MADLEVTLDASSLPTNTSGTLTVYEDVGNDGSGANSFTDADDNSHNYDNTNSTALSDGQTSYTLSGFDASSGNGIWVDVQLDNSDDVSTAQLTEQVSVSVV